MATTPGVVVKITFRLTSGWRKLIPLVDEDTAAWIDEHADPEEDPPQREPDSLHEQLRRIADVSALDLDAVRESARRIAEAFATQDEATIPPPPPRLPPLLPDPVVPSS